LQFAGGKRIVVDSCDIRCGDDCIALVNDVPGQAKDIEYVVVSNCDLHSRGANIIRLHVETGFTKEVRWVRISNIVGKVGDDITTTSGGIHIINEDVVVRRIHDVEIDGVILDASQGSVEPVVISSVERVRLVNVNVRQPKRRILIDWAIDVELRDCSVDMRSGADPTQQCVLVAGASNAINVRFRGGQYRNATQHGIQIGSPDFQVAVVEVSNVWISGAVNNGLLLWNASNAIVSNNMINSGGWGIQEFGALSDNNLFLGNYLSGNTFGPLSLVGAASEAIRNVAGAGVPVQDTGGFRQTIDGWTISSTAASGTFLERFNIANATGHRFRAVRPGSVTGLVITSTADCSAGTLTVTVWKNTGLADGTVLANPTTLTATLSTTAGQTSRVAVTVPKDSIPFVAGDEIYLQMTKSGFMPSADICCSFDIED